MPNGKCLPDNVFEMLEYPLLRTDKVLEEFAMHVGGRIEINYHYCPGRMVLAEDPDGITEQIEITPMMLNVNRAWVDGNYVYFVGVTIWRDATEGRYSSHKEILRTEKLPKDPKEIRKLLEQCWAEIQELKKGKLKLYPAYDPHEREDNGASYG